MNDENGTVVEISETKKRRAPARRTASAGTARKRTARRPGAPRRRKASRGPSFEGVIRSITGGVGVARAAIAEASGQGAVAVQRALGTASKASRRTITRLAEDWKAMDPKKKARVLAALLGVAAAASAPLVRSRWKKR